jgi:RNA polymerase sigma-70 factor (ECF subfamily)
MRKAGLLVVDEPDEATEPAAPNPFQETFEAFYLREFGAMVAIAFAVSGSRLIAEDIAQEAMIRAHRNWERVSTYDKPGAWVRRVTINLASSALRRRASEVRARLRLGAGEPVPEPEPADAHIWAAVRRLPGQQRAAVALFYLEERTVHEIAAVLGCSEATAKVHLHRGRTALAAALSTNHQERK